MSAPWIFVGTVGLVALWFAYGVSNNFHVAINRLLGARAVVIRGTGRANNIDMWKAIAKRDPWGELYAYRYPASKIGRVDLNADGTGEYCGPVEWLPLGKKGNVL